MDLWIRRAGSGRLGRDHPSKVASAVSHLFAPNSSERLEQLQPSSDPTRARSLPSEVFIVSASLRATGKALTAPQLFTELVVECLGKAVEKRRESRSEVSITVVLDEPSLVHVKSPIDLYLDAVAAV
jgi:hypothetical protein